MTYPVLLGQWPTSTLFAWSMTYHFCLVNDLPLFARSMTYPCVLGQRPTSAHFAWSQTLPTLLINDLPVFLAWSITYSFRLANDLLLVPWSMTHPFLLCQ